MGGQLRIAVVGAGTMGHGIAQVAAVAGYDTRLTDANPSAKAVALAKVRENLDGAVKRSKLSREDADAALHRLAWRDDLAAAVAGVDLVIEAIVEELDAKRELFGRLADIKVRCRLQDGVTDVRLPVAAEIQVLRIIQEALSNVRKHARATDVMVSLSSRNGHLRAVVADNGCGFDPANYERGEWPQFGLQTMRERAEAVGGRFHLRSLLGHGTRVSVAIPLALERKRTG